MRRALTSVLLNTAEASGVRGGSRRQRFLTACGSSMEVRAGLDAADALGYIEPVEPACADLHDKIIATLYKLSH